MIIEVFSNLYNSMILRRKESFNNYRVTQQRNSAEVIYVTHLYGTSSNGMHCSSIISVLTKQMRKKHESGRIVPDFFPITFEYISSTVDIFHKRPEKHDVVLEDNEVSTTTQSNLIPSLPPKGWTNKDYIIGCSELDKKSFLRAYKLESVFISVPSHPSEKFS